MSFTEFLRWVLSHFYIMEEPSSKEAIEPIDNAPTSPSEPVVEPPSPSPYQHKAENLKAFLDTIAFAEGTIRLGDDGYNVIVGGSLFHDYSDHPNVLVSLPRLGISSTAAGRYQILYRFWKHYKAEMRLPDFSPASQDKYAMRMLRERRALSDVEHGRVSIAIEKCRNIWASFPNAGYGQREVSLKSLLEFYQSRGGILCESDKEMLNAKAN